VSVTAATGFRAAGVAAAIKSSGGLDLALVVNDGPSDAAAGVFTANRIKAAPVLWSQQVLTSGRLRAVVLNSGGANACTGPAGFADTHATVERVGALLEVGPGEVAVCSTGLIGERLPIDAVLAGVSAAAAGLTVAGGRAAAAAIMTTDTVPKTAVRRGDGYIVGGMAKGAGMLAPALATMLCVITTDADVDSAALDKALRAATATTFDRLDADGCMSTNDTVLLLASGASGVRTGYDDFAAAVRDVCADLAAQLLADVEGSTKRIAITVTAAASTADAIEVGRAVARSSLLKCALYGNDPNWGRVLAAAGTTRAAFDPDRIDVAINGAVVCRNGTAAADRSTVDMTAPGITIDIDLHEGGESVTVWTSDLTPGYVHENSVYSS